MTVAEYVVKLPLPEGEGECKGETLPLLKAVRVVVTVADAVPDTVLVKNAVGSVALGDGEFDPVLLRKPVPEVVEQPLVEGETLAVAEYTGEYVGETLPQFEAVRVVVIVADAEPDTVLVKNAVYVGETLPQFEAVRVVVIVAVTELDTDFVKNAVSSAVLDTVLVKKALGSVALGVADPLLLLKPVPEVIEVPLVEGETLAVAEHEGSAP